MDLKVTDTGWVVFDSQQGSYGGVFVDGGNGGNAGAGGRAGGGGQSGWAYQTNNVSADKFGQSGSPGTRGSGGEGALAGSIEVRAQHIRGGFLARGGSAGGLGASGARGGTIRVIAAEAIDGAYDVTGGRGSSGASGAPAKFASVTGAGNLDGLPGSSGLPGAAGGRVEAETMSFQGVVSASGGSGGGGGGSDGISQADVGWTEEEIHSRLHNRGGNGGSGGAGGPGGTVVIRAVEFPGAEISRAGGDGGDGGPAGHGQIWSETITNWLHPLATPGSTGATGTPPSISTNKLPSALAVDLQVEPESGRPGQALTYYLVPRAITNQSGVEVSAAIPEHTRFVSASGEGFLADGRVTWKFTSWNTPWTQCSFMVRVDNDMPSETWLTNRARIFSAQRPQPIESAPVLARITSPAIVVELSAYEVTESGSRLGPVHRITGGSAGRVGGHSGQPFGARHYPRQHYGSTD